MEAEAAMALEQQATGWLQAHPAPEVDEELQAAGLDLHPLLARLFALADQQTPQAVAEGAALFHVALASALARAAILAARERGCRSVALGGGCFFNRLLTARLSSALQQAGLAVHLPQATNVGDAGLALGQAWAAAAQLAAGLHQDTPASQETLCA
jgi:hydrogenase maturation protein HypF